MRDRQGRHRWEQAAAAFLLLTIPLLYPLSLGPAVLIFESMGRPQGVEPYLEVIYSPLIDLPEPIESALDWYVDLWCP